MDELSIIKKYVVIGIKAQFGVGLGAVSLLLLSWVLKINTAPTGEPTGFLGGLGFAPFMLTMGALGFFALVGQYLVQGYALNKLWKWK